MNTAALIITKKDDGTYTILDALGRVHDVATAAGLGPVCDDIVTDPQMPQYKTQAAHADNLEAVATQVAEAVFPESFRFMAVPAVGLLKKAVKGLKVLSVPRGDPVRAAAARRRKGEADKRKKEAQERAERAVQRRLRPSPLP
jgi:hypothetical protein